MAKAKIAKEAGAHKQTVGGCVRRARIAGARVSDFRKRGRHGRQPLVHSRPHQHPLAGLRLSQEGRSIAAPPRDLQRKV
jgi:hypothetical protein